MTGGSETPEVSERMFGGQTSSIRAARLFVRQAAAEVLDLAGPESDLQDDLELAVSELVTNAIEHGLEEPVTVTVIEQLVVTVIEQLVVDVFELAGQRVGHGQFIRGQSWPSGSIGNAHH